MPQLTTPQAEQLLARACENESDNAKRMRLGLDPISQPMPVYSQANLIDVLVSTGIRAILALTNLRKFS